MLPYFTIGSLTLFTYPLLLGVNIGLAYRLIQYFQTEEGKPISSVRVYFPALLGFTWLGSKVLYLVTSFGIDQSELALKPSFWLGGGLVFYGGLIGGGIFSWLYFTSNKISYKRISFLAVIMSFTHALGRIGCFLAGCCFGIESDSFISVHIHHADRIPVQLFEAFCLILLGLYLWKLWRDNKKENIFFIYFISYSIIRFILEFLRDDQIRGVFQGLSTSQWISILIFSLALAHKFWAKNEKVI